MLTITRISKFKYQFKSVREGQEERMKEILSKQPAGYYFSPLFQDGKWDGYVKFYDTKNCFYAGLLEEAKNQLTEAKIKFLVTEGDIKITTIDNIEFDKRLRAHQKESLESFFKKNFGIIKIPTRGGKTFIAAESIRIISKDNPEVFHVFFVDTIDLFSQSVKEIAVYLGKNESDIGTINDKGFNPKQITVAMIQSTISLFKNKKKGYICAKFFKTVGNLIVDEVHEYSSDKRMSVLKKFINVDFIMALSATPFKGNNEIGNIKLKGFFHDIVYTVTEQRLKKDKVLAEDKVILIAMQHYLSRKDYLEIDDLVGVKKYQLYQKKIIYENKKRDIVLLTLIQICVELNLKTLVLFVSKIHGNTISRLSDNTFISGDDNADVRKKAKDKFLKGKGKVLLASDIWKKGITLPQVEIFINADGGLEETNVIQKKGRVLGAIEGKDRALIIDFMDIFDDYFSEHSYNRLGVYEESVGDEKIDIYQAELDFKEEVKSNIYKWFNGKR